MNEPVYFKVEGLHKNFGGLAAVNDLTFQLEKGAIHGLIGPNGAGKTTIFNVISGFYKPSAGKVLYRGEDIGGLQPHRVAAKGLVRTFQETVLFQEFTTFENALMGRYLHTKSSMISALFATQRASERANEVKALEVLDFLGLAERKDELALNLPHGLQRALGIAVALAAEPSLLLLDEPFAGVDPISVNDIKGEIRDLARRDIGVLITDHNVRDTLDICDRAYIVNEGHIIAEGEPGAILADQQVRNVYLGDSFRL